jgi:hypothetical protein
MGNILMKINLCNCSNSILFINLEERKIINTYKFPLCLAKSYAKNKNLEFLYKENNIYKFSLNKTVKIMPVILSIKDDSDIEILEKFLNYDNVPIWLILFNEKINTKELKITFIKNGKNIRNYDMKENKYFILNDLLKINI